MAPDRRPLVPAGLLRKEENTSALSTMDCLTALRREDRSVSRVSPPAPGECGARYATPAGLPSAPSRLTVASRTPCGADEAMYRILFYGCQGLFCYNINPCWRDFKRDFQEFELTALLP